MLRNKTRAFVLLTDIIAINISYLAVFWIRFTSGILSLPVAVEPEYIASSAALITAYWLLLFIVAGLHRDWYAESRFDEMVLVVKTVTVGVFILFFLTFDPNRPVTVNRVTLLLFWSTLSFLVTTGRLVVRSIQRGLMVRGIGRRPTLIVGFNDTGRKLLADVRNYPALGYEVVGFVDADPDRIGQEKDGVAVLGSYTDLSGIIRLRGIREILIASRPSSHEEILDILSHCQGDAVNYNIVPDLYEILSGHVKTNAIYGFPLMKMLPDLMPPWERNIKRMSDIGISLLVLVLGAPFWLLMALIIKLDSKGPALYSQVRVGQNGKDFTIYKFRSMVQDAEKGTGAVWAQSADPRITRLGRFIRKTRIDEVPQFINILKGDMSFVGPRPERPEFVETLAKEIPIYTKRLNVKPGLTGLAQTKHHYDASLEDVREKVKYDLYYIENMSLTLDFKIILRTVYVVFTGSGAR